MRGAFLERLQAQILSAIGEEDDKQFRILKLAVQKLANERADLVYQNANNRLKLPAKALLEPLQKRPLPSQMTISAPNDTFNVDQAEQAAKKVVQYPVVENASDRIFRKPFRGDDEQVMWEGSLVKASDVMDSLIKGRRGRPMLPAMVGADAPDCEGVSSDFVAEEPSAALVTPAADSANPPSQQASAPATINDEAAFKTGSSSAAALFGDDGRSETASDPPPSPTGRRSRSSKSRDTAERARPQHLQVNHLHENRKAAEMRAATLAGGRASENVPDGPLPGCHFWRGFALAAVGPPDPHGGRGRRL